MRDRHILPHKAFDNVLREQASYIIAFGHINVGEDSRRESVHRYRDTNNDTETKAALQVSQLIE